MHKQTVAFERLWQWTDDARKIYRKHSDNGLPSNLSNLHIPLLDINPEGQLEKEIKDIVEELEIMIHINKTQRDVFKQFKAHVEHILDPSGELAATQSKAKTARQNWNCRRNSLAPEFFSSPPASPGKPLSGNGAPKIRMQTSLQLADPVDPEKEDKFKPLENFKWFKLNAEEMQARINDRIEQLEELERNAETTAASVRQCPVNPPRRIVANLHGLAGQRSSRIKTTAGGGTPGMASRQPSRRDHPAGPLYHDIHRRHNRICEYLRIMWHPIVQNITNNETVASAVIHVQHLRYECY